MSASDFFYYSVGIGFVVSVLVWIFLAFQVTKTLQDVRKILQDVGSTTGDITALKDLIKYGASALGGILGARSKGFGRRKSK